MSSRDSTDGTLVDLAHSPRLVGGRAGAKTGTILLTPNERRVAQDRRDCYCLYVMTSCAEKAELQEPVEDPAQFEGHEVTKMAHYWLEVDAMTRPMRVREERTASWGERA